MDTASLLILGAGGHAKGVIDIIRAQGIDQIHGLTSPNVATETATLSGYPIIGDDTLIAETRASGVQYCIVGMGAVGNNAARQRLYELGLHHGMTPVAAIHPAAIVAPDARICSGSALFAGAIIGASCHIGHNVIVNHGAVVDHDCQIQDHVHIAPKACLCGDVRVGFGAHVGAGATVLQGISIGNHAMVAAGAVVVKDVKAGSTVIGVPARAR